MVLVGLILPGLALWQLFGRGASAQPYQLPADPPIFAIMDWSPFGWQDRENAKGILVNIVRLIEKELGVELMVVIAPMTRVVDGMENGRYDFTVAYRDPIVMSDVNYLGDVGCLNNNVVSLKRRPITTLRELQGLRVAYPAESPFLVKVTPLLESMDIRTEGMIVFKSEVIFNVLKRGRVQAIIVNDAVLNAYRMGRLGDSLEAAMTWEELAPPLAIEELPLAIAASTTTSFTGLAKRIKRALQTVTFKAAIRQMYEQYGMQPVTSCAR